MDWMNQLTFFPVTNHDVLGLVLFVTLIMVSFSLCFGIVQFFMKARTARHNWEILAAVVGLAVGLPCLTSLMALQVPCLGLPSGNSVVAVIVFTYIPWGVVGPVRFLSFGRTEWDVAGAFGLTDSLSAWAQRRTEFYEKVDGWRKEYEKKYST